jgi:hypothetical protein
MKNDFWIMAGFVVIIAVLIGIADIAATKKENDRKDYVDKYNEELFSRIKTLVDSARSKSDTGFLIQGNEIKIYDSANGTYQK